MLVVVHKKQWMLVFSKSHAAVVYIAPRWEFFAQVETFSTCAGVSLPKNHIAKVTFGFVRVDSYTYLDFICRHIRFNYATPFSM